MEHWKNFSLQFKSKNMVEILNLKILGDNRETKTS